MLVAQALGHKDVKVTMRYLLSKEDRIRKALNDRHKKAA
jgi:site-specific recombinase XerD